MKIRFGIVPFTLALALTGMAQANPGAPDFSPALYGDGEIWGTKGAATLPAPNEHNMQSFDKLFVFVNGAPGQLPVAEAAPGNRLFNGGRWATQTAMWTAEGMAAHDPLPVLMSYEEVQLHHDLGHLAIAPGSPGDTPDYFECPLLPVH
jgi:hypothetical protein